METQPIKLVHTLPQVQELTDALAPAYPEFVFKRKNSTEMKVQFDITGEGGFITVGRYGYDSWRSKLWLISDSIQRCLERGDAMHTADIKKAKRIFAQHFKVKHVEDYARDCSRKISADINFKWRAGRAEQDLRGQITTQLYSSIIEAIADKPHAVMELLGIDYIPGSIIHHMDELNRLKKLEQSKFLDVLKYNKKWIVYDPETKNYNEFAELPPAIAAKIGGLKILSEGQSTVEHTVYKLGIGAISSRKLQQFKVIMEDETHDG